MKTETIELIVKYGEVNMYCIYPFDGIDGGYANGSVYVYIGNTKTEVPVFTHTRTEKKMREKDLGDLHFTDNWIESNGCIDRIRTLRSIPESVDSNIKAVLPFSMVQRIASKATSMFLDELQKATDDVNHEKHKIIQDAITHTE